VCVARRTEDVDTSSMSYFSGKLSRAGTLLPHSVSTILTSPFFDARLDAILLMAFFALPVSVP